MKNQNGITLIALVITIIVLLILAGVSIAMLTGENGILSRATTAGDTTKLAEAKEAAALQVNAVMTDFYNAKYVNGTAENTADFLTYAKAHQADLADDQTPARYTVDASGHITISGSAVTGDIQKDGGIHWSDAATGS